MFEIRAPPPGYVRNEDLFVITYIYVVFGEVTLPASLFEVFDFQELSSCS